MQRQFRNPTEQISAAIGIARVMCILGIVYVHAWTGLDGYVLGTVNETPQGMLRWGLIELVGRSAVPLLGMISGWLVAGSVERRPWGVFIGGKARTILLPMVLWNAIAILTVSSAARLGLIQAPMADSLWWVVDELFCLITANDINVQMSFLRDLFLCMVAATVLRRLPSWALVAVVLATVAWTISWWSFPLLLRPSILSFFVIGMLARRGGWAAWLGARPIALVALPYLALVAARVWTETAGAATLAEHASYVATLDLMLRGAAALLFWSIAWRLAASRAAAPILRIEPYAFLMFCAHLIMIWLGGPVIGKLTGPLGSPLYPLFLLFQPALAMLATIGLGRLLLAVAPNAAFILSGGRLKSTEEPRRALSPVTG